MVDWKYEHIWGCKTIFFFDSSCLFQLFLSIYIFYFFMMSRPCIAPRGFWKSQCSHTRAAMLGSVSCADNGTGKGEWHWSHSNWKKNRGHHSYVIGQERERGKLGPKEPQGGKTEEGANHHSIACLDTYTIHTGSSFEGSSAEQGSVLRQWKSALLFFQEGFWSHYVRGRWSR